MDKQYLEFWGNLLLQAAKGQAQLENFNKWLSQAGGGFQHLNDLFKRAYGLEAATDVASGDSPAWQKAFDRFSKAHEAYLALLQVVPMARFRELEAQNAALQKEVKRLKAELTRSGRRPTDGVNRQPEDVMTEFNNLLQKQQLAFEALTEQMSGLWPPESTDTD